MSRPKSTPRGRVPRAPTRPLRCRCQTRCACHVPLPGLPRRVQAREVAYLQKFIDWPQSIETVPLPAGALSLAARARLLARAEQRGRRLTATERHVSGDLFWLDKELRLVVPAAHRKVADRWRIAVEWRVRHAERMLRDWQTLADFLRVHEPDADAWLRRQLATLDGGEA